MCFVNCWGCLRLLRLLIRNHTSSHWLLSKREGCGLASTSWMPFKESVFLSSNRRTFQEQSHKFCGLLVAGDACRDPSWVKFRGNPNRISCCLRRHDSQETMFCIPQDDIQTNTVSRITNRRIDYHSNMNSIVGIYRNGWNSCIAFVILTAIGLNHEHEYHRQSRNVIYAKHFECQPRPLICMSNDS